MSGACVDDTETIELLLSGSPGTLEANVRNPSSTFSGTQGDYTLHNVTDTGVEHTQSQTLVINNTGSARTKGIVVVALDPIFLTPIESVVLRWHTELIIAGVTVDEGNKNGQEAAYTGDGLGIWLPVKDLVGQINIAPGGSVSVTWNKSVENTAASAQWEFLMGGDKLVANLGY